MDIAELIAERLIVAAMENGAFERFAGPGKPIPDLDRMREPGWWAARAIAEERNRSD